MVNCYTCNAQFHPFFHLSLCCWCRGCCQVLTGQFTDLSWTPVPYLVSVSSVWLLTYMEDSLCPSIFPSVFPSPTLYPSLCPLSFPPCFSLFCFSISLFPYLSLSLAPSHSATVHIMFLSLSFRKLADSDRDGRLSFEEFVVAMHLIFIVKLGLILPISINTNTIFPPEVCRVAVL